MDHQGPRVSADDVVVVKPKFLEAVDLRVCNNLNVAFKVFTNLELDVCFFDVIVDPPPQEFEMFGFEIRSTWRKDEVDCLPAMVSFGSKGEYCTFGWTGANVSFLMR